MISKEEFEKAVECCASDITDCDGCPLCASDKHRMCSTYLAEYITKNEPALSANSTSSEVVSKDTNSTHLDDSTKDQICQEAEKAYKACELILEIYERMDDSEQKAFDLGQSYRAMVEVKKELERIGRGGVPNA